MPRSILRLSPRAALTAAAAISFALAAAAETPDAEAAVEASAPAPDYSVVWDLRDLYETPEAWEAARETILADIDALDRFKGTLDEGPEAVLDAFETMSDVTKETLRLFTYASLKADEDVRIAENDARRQRAQLVFAKLASATSWVAPEIQALGEDAVRGYLAAEPDLAPHRFFLEEILRRAPHTLGAEAETVLAATLPVASGPRDIYNVLANADMPWPEITLSTGETALLNQAGYARLRQAENREDRKKVFDTFWGVWKAYETTFGATLGSHLQGLRLQTEQRGYESSVERAFFDDAMPAGVYDTLIERVNASLPTLHRYFNLRKRMLGIDGEMGYHDIYPPLVSLDATFDLDTSIALTRDALAPLGAEYIAAYDAGVEGGWIHVYPQPGKRSGAYMNGSAYDVHPYVLLNHNDDYDSASTFAHEYGHAVHSVLANAAQPFETADYTTFVAETASIMNEMLLQDLVVERAETPQEKLFYLGAALESLHGTYFRQAMFAEFELKANELVDAGEAVTGEGLTAVYLDLLKRYHGHEAGVMKIEDLYGMEWAYIPHFYYDFYVFQYATSIAAASSLAEQIGSGDTAARDRFIALLKAGGSDHPYDLMKAAGVDLATAAPYDALDRRANAIMDEMEAILAAEGR